jgi:hypothetical protein
MTLVQISNIKIDVDVEQTKKIYASIEKGGCLKCGCAYCRNFLVQLPGLFPKEVQRFFSDSGIDPLKDAEVYELGVNPSGKHQYGGEYYFIVNGEYPLETATFSEGMQMYLSGISPLVPNEFEKVPGAVCINIAVEIPWVLRERL